jgi:hypothetical protein
MAMFELPQDLGAMGVLPVAATDSTAPENAMQQAMASFVLQPGPGSPPPK